jgi:acyl carrier protein
LKNNFRLLKEDLLKIFIRNFKLNKNTILKLKNNKIDLKFNEHEQWDSLKHASILTDLEKKFAIQLNSSTIINLNSFTSILNFLKQKAKKK